jgi:hypothetical protein
VSFEAEKKRMNSRKNWMKTRRTRFDWEVVNRSKLLVSIPSIFDVRAGDLLKPDKEGGSSLVP